MAESKGPLKRNQCILEVRPFKIWRPNSSGAKAPAEQAQEPELIALAPGKRASTRARARSPRAVERAGKADRSWRLHGLT